MVDIRQADMDTDRELIDELWWEYLTWVGEQNRDMYGPSPDLRKRHEAHMAELEAFAPPDGRLLLVYEEEQPVGVAGLRRIGPDVGEIRRMYIRPAYRRRGIGRVLIEVLIAAAREAGYTALRLESGRSMVPAHRLYRGVGFREIAPYPESALPPELHRYMMFMEKRL